MDEFELTRRALGDPGSDPEARERIRARLRRAIDAERPSRRSRFLAAAVAAALVVVIVSILVMIAPGPGGRSAAAAELRRLAGVAATSEGLDPEPGEYVLVPSEERRIEGTVNIVTGIEYSVVSRLDVQTWISPDGSGVRRIVVISSELASEDDRRAWIEAGRPALPEPGEVRIERYAAGEAPWYELDDLPRDPDPLLEALRAGRVVPRPPGDQIVFSLIGTLLAQGDAPPELRSALLEAAARLQGIRLIGEFTDPIGRAGVALETTSADGSVTRLVFDPDTARLLAIEEMIALPEQGAPPLRSWRAFHPATIDDAPPAAEG